MRHYEDTSGFTFLNWSTDWPDDCKGREEKLSSNQVSGRLKKRWMQPGCDEMINVEERWKVVFTHLDSRGGRVSTGHYLQGVSSRPTWPAPVALWSCMQTLQSWAHLVNISSPPARERRGETFLRLWAVAKYIAQMTKCLKVTLDEQTGSPFQSVHLWNKSSRLNSLLITSNIT